MPSLKGILSKKRAKCTFSNSWHKINKRVTYWHSGWFTCTRNSKNEFINYLCMVWNLLFTCHNPVEIKGQQLNKHPNYHKLWGIHELSVRRHSFIFRPGCAFFKHSTSHRSILVRHSWLMERSLSKLHWVNNEYATQHQFSLQKEDFHHSEHVDKECNAFSQFKISQDRHIGQKHPARKTAQTSCIEQRRNRTIKPNNLITRNFSSLILKQSLISKSGFPGGASCQEHVCQRRR